MRRTAPPPSAQRCHVLPHRSPDEDVRHRALTRDGLEGILNGAAVFYLVQFNSLLQDDQKAAVDKEVEGSFRAISSGHS